MEEVGIVTALVKEYGFGIVGYIIGWMFWREARDTRKEAIDNLKASFAIQVADTEAKVRMSAAFESLREVIKGRSAP